MRRPRAAAALLLAAFACDGSETARRPAPRGGLRLETVVSGLEAPLHLVAPPGDTQRLFVVEQAGRIRVVREGRLLPLPYLDLTDRVGSGGERGLLSLAFHPDFSRNGRLFVNYTDRDGDTRITRFTAESAADTAPRASEHLVLAVDQPYANHNGGHLLFGPGGFLYAGTGDGGAAGDPHGNAQDARSLLGKLLRLDVSGDAARITIHARGLRNPWRMAFDTAAHLLYIADVGQNRWEEINAVVDTASGLDYGWRRMEGSHCFLVPVCAESGVQPVYEYGHDLGCSVTGGVVYRGRALPFLRGHYLFSDYCSGWLHSFRLVDGRAVEVTDWGVTAGQVLSFGEDAAGEVYVLTAGGTVYRIVAR